MEEKTEKRLTLYNSDFTSNCPFAFKIPSPPSPLTISPCPTFVNAYLLTVQARITLTSRFANSCPMQLLGPLSKGRQALGGTPPPLPPDLFSKFVFSLVSVSPSQRSGTKSLFEFP